MVPKTKTNILISLFLLLLVLAGCKDQKKVNAQSTETPLPVLKADIHPCDNIFYPLTRDNQWIYQIEYDGQPSSDSLTETSLTIPEVGPSSAILAALDYDTGLVTQTTVDCQDGSIVNFPITELNFIPGEVNGQLDFQHKSGIFMPSEDQFINSNWELDWQTEYSANGELSAPFDGESFSATLSSSPVKMDWEVVGTGSTLSVPAGDFNDIVEIRRKIEIDVTSLEAMIAGQNINVSTTLTVVTNMVYAPHIGLIKQEFESASIRFFGRNFPIDTDGKIELKSYIVNN